MSYWDEHEKQPGDYDFTQLDAQITAIRKLKGEISLCLGVRQPRWPESHWPKWVLDLPVQRRYAALEKYIEVVVKRYRDENCVTSYQLENECLNRSFGKNGDFSRERLRSELKLVKKLDSSRPVIMSTSNSWGLPLKKPKPDIFGFSYYMVEYKNGRYNHSKLPYWWWGVRAKVVTFITRRPVFIHELQAEPWGPKAIWEMTYEQQMESMNPDQLKLILSQAKLTKLYPIDLWGAEWWYWRKVKLNDESLVNIVRQAMANSDTTP